MAPDTGSKWEIHSDEEIKAALLECHGMALPAAKLLKMTHAALLDRLNRHPELAAYREQCRVQALEGLGETALGKLMGRVEKDDWKAVEHVLNSKFMKESGLGISQTVENQFDLSDIPLEVLMAKREEINAQSEQAKDSNPNSD